MMHRIRLALANDSWEMLGGSGEPIEMDEAYIGGKPKNMHANRRLRLCIGENGYAKKTAVFGMLDRGTREVRAKVVPNAKRETLQKEILAQVGFGSTIYTDNAPAYDHLKQKFVHDTVTHINEYVKGQVHTQGIENFWSLLKRGLNGTYVAVEPYHLSRYVDEQVFRFNNRIGMNDRMRFEKVLRQIAGKRLTYAELTGKVGETPRGACAAQ
jgi:transposase-like protein